MNQNKYFIKLFDRLELEVTKEQFIETEKVCGFYPKVEGETATGGFGYQKMGLEVKGRIEYVESK